MGKKKSKEKQKKRKGPIQRAPAQAQDNQSENSSTSRSRSPQLGQSVSNYEEQQPETSGANDAAPVSRRLEDAKFPFNNTMNLEFVATLLNDIKPPALVLIDRDGAGVIDHRPLLMELLDRIDKGLTELILRDPQNESPQVQHHRLTLHDLRVHLEAALDDYEDFVRRGARVGEIAANETDVEDEAAGPSGCNAPSDDVDLDEPGPSNRKMAEYHDCPFDRLHSSVHPIIRTRAPNCVPSTNNVFLFAYSNDLDVSTVAGLRDSVVYDWAWQHDPIVGNVRFDVKQEEEIQFHRDIASFKSSVSSRLPNPSLGYGDNTTGSDVFNAIQKFLDNSEAPVCNAVLYIIVKRYPGTNQTNYLVSQLQNNHVYVYYHVHSEPSGGQYRHVMFDMAALTNGFCIFADDNSKTKEFTRSARNGVGLINRPYQYISKRYVVNPGFGRIELPTFQNPNPNASKEQVLAVTTLEETPLDGRYLSLNYTVKSVDGTVLTTFPGGNWTRLGSGIINYFDMYGKVDYNWTIDYHYSAGRQQVIEHRVYGFYYHDFLPFAKIVP